MMAIESCHCLSLLAVMFHLVGVCVFLSAGALVGLLILLRSKATDSFSYLLHAASMLK